MDKIFSQQKTHFVSIRSLQINISKQEKTKCKYISIRRNNLIIRDSKQIQCLLYMRIQEKPVINMDGIGLLKWSLWAFGKKFILSLLKMFRSIMFGRETDILAKKRRLSILLLLWIFLKLLSNRIRL